MAKRVWLFKSYECALVYQDIEIRKESTRTEAGYLIPRDTKIEGV
jgi:hypothetical protein